MPSCQYCDNDYANISSLNAHIKQKHGLPSICPKCNGEYKSIYYYNKHIVDCTKEPCVIIGTSASTAQPHSSMHNAALSSPPSLHTETSNHQNIQTSTVSTQTSIDLMSVGVQASYETSNVFTQTSIDLMSVGIQTSCETSDFSCQTWNISPSVTRIDDISIDDDNHTKASSNDPDYNTSITEDDGEYYEPNPKYNITLNPSLAAPYVPRIGKTLGMRRPRLFHRTTAHTTTAGKVCIYLILLSILWESCQFND